MTASWPRARLTAGDGTAPLPRAVMRSVPEDFRVTELPEVLPDGEGEHLYLRIEKTSVGTPDLAAALARAFGVAPVAVGYAGMKDKHAVTEQWFSVHTPAGPEGLPELPGVRVRGACRQPRKLRRGDLLGNRFRIRLRGLAAGEGLERLAQIRADGVPNYFGTQRFGTDNLSRALDWLPERRRRRLRPFQSGLYLSVLRSFLFNEVLAARVRDDTWNCVVDGDVTMALPVAGSPPASGREVATGPLWGRGRSPAGAQAAEREASALAPHQRICDGLEHAGLSQARRSLVLGAPDLTWQTEDTGLELAFTLPPGGYATVLLGEAFDLHTCEGVP